MKDNFERRPVTDKQHSHYFFLPFLAAYTAQKISGIITNIVAVTVTVVVTILVLLGGLWLVMIYLPVNIVNILIAVIIADITLGIVLRATLLSR